MSKTILIKLVLCLWKIILACGKTRLFYLGQVALHSLLFYFSYDLQQKLIISFCLQTTALCYMLNITDVFGFSNREVLKEEQTIQAKTYLHE